MKRTKILAILVLRSELLRRVALVLALGLMLGEVEVGKAAPMGTAFTYQGRLMETNKPADGFGLTRPSVSIIVSFENM